MRTLIVSDLHLGTHTRADVLRHPRAREALLEAVAGVDRLVLLGDTIELRSGPVGRVLAAARPFFEALRVPEVILVPGNHDHALIAPWLERNEQPLGTERRVAPAEASPAAATLAGFVGGRADLAYPGVWLRADVYATHGHYLDCHVTIPTFERIAIGAMGRMSGPGAAGPRRPEEYEALVAPVYAWIHAVAQTARAGAMNGAGSARAWRVLARPGGARPQLRARALAAAFPLAVAALNRAGLGPLRSDLSGDGLRQGRLAAMAAVVERLGLDAGHVIFGHTHRTGPLPGDAPGEWLTAGGTRLVNSGSWVLDAHMTRTGRESPYWPGGCVTLDDDGPPRLVRLLDGLAPAELHGV
ncbi:MAG: metallophosphoesterase family protein [Actinobacteria bacterium]|nr:metallophosphoesterase family protein [Actinomycetota bacterium]